MAKIAIIGAGSMVFSKNVLSDILALDALKDTTFSLMDVDAERLALVGAMAESISATRKALTRLAEILDAIIAKVTGSENAALAQFI